MILPDYISPSEFRKRMASVGISISERELRRRARELGAYRQIGKAMFFLPEDLERIMEPKIDKQRQPRKSAALDNARRKLQARKRSRSA